MTKKQLVEMIRRVISEESGFGDIDLTKFNEFLEFNKQYYDVNRIQDIESAVHDFAEENGIRIRNKDAKSFAQYFVATR